MIRGKIQIRNRIGLSIIIVAVWSSIVLFLSAITFSSDISPIYFWIKMSTLVAGYGALTCLFLRFLDKLDQATNFTYTLLATSNLAFGLCGLIFYFLHKINLIGLHDLLLSLLLGIILFADIFFFDDLFKKA